MTRTFVEAWQRAMPQRADNCWQCNRRRWLGTYVRHDHTGEPKDLTFACRECGRELKREGYVYTPGIQREERRAS